MKASCAAQKRTIHDVLQDENNEVPEALRIVKKELNCCSSLASSSNVVLPVSKDLRVQKQPCMRLEEKEISSDAVPTMRLPQRPRDNLCLFFAALNVLDAEKQVAFTKGDTTHPEKAFLEWAKEDKHIQNRDPLVEGYNFKDLHAYLQHLLKERYITSYVWKNLSKWSKIPSQLLFGDKLRNSRALIIGGIAPCADLRSQMRRKLKRRMDSLVEYSKLERQKESVRFYQQFSFTTKWTSGNSSNHAIGIRQINGQPYIFDSGRRAAVKLNDIYDIAWSLGQCCDGYEFGVDITV
jgi:hypothetical protein